MPSDKYPTPRQYPGIMISSTFTDLEKHRAALIEAISNQELHEVAMENSSAKTIDVIDSSLQMVRDGSAYIGVIGHKYGQMPPCPQRNSGQLSITELEFNEAQRLERPILLFIMGDSHPIVKADVESDPTKQEKLNLFRERAKQIGPNAPVHRIYATFNSLEEFSKQAIQAVAELRRYLDERSALPILLQKITSSPTGGDPIPSPPAFYAEPPYIGSHKFVGRQAQLETLSDWATSADSHPVLLFEAIGGTGKSMLTWEWMTKHSSNVRADWAGRFWYSFYEKGATMVDFCRRALAYMMCQPRANFRERNTAELTELLLHQFQARPWLLILDGLERVLVSYHRFDAAQVRDDEAGTVDKIAHRDPCAAINPEDDDLLRALAGARPSKFLLTSRLIPRILLNKSNQPIPGVFREPLPGLRPADAESLIRGCGIKGTSQDIQFYLKSHCDCHPLVIGVLAGLINDYLPDRGNFDRWAADPVGGGKLNLANLDLAQKRNNILDAAFAALPEASCQLLSTLALLSESVDYPTLRALDPHLSPIPEEVPLPKNPEHGARWQKMSDDEKAKARADYHASVQRRGEYERVKAKREEEMHESAQRVTAIVKNLESRGLLQYDAVTKRYDLHPVVRGISAGGLKHEEKNRYGQRVVDHFSQQALDPYEQAESLKDFDSARHIVKVLLQMGKMTEASDFILSNNFIQELNHRFEAHNDILTIIQPFFSVGWQEMPNYLKDKGGISLAQRASVSLRRIGALQDAFDVSEAAIRVILEQNKEHILFAHLLNLASTCGEQNHLALEDRLICFASDVVLANGDNHGLISWRLARFRQLSRLAKWSDALTVWSHLEGSQLPPNTLYIAAHHHAVHLFTRGELTEEALANAEELNRSANSALGNRNLCVLRGLWRLEHGDFEPAKKSLRDAVALAHKAGKMDRRSEIYLTVAKLNLDEVPEPILVAEQFTYGLDASCYRALAELWFAIGDHEQATKHALDAYKWAWADGVPYVRSYELDKTCALLYKLGTELPQLPLYDPTNVEKLPWEDRMVAAIEKLRTRGYRQRLLTNEAERLVCG